MATVSQIKATRGGIMTTESQIKATRRWANNNPEKISLTKKRYYQNHKEAIKAKTLNYYLENKPKRLEQMKKTSKSYYQLHKEEMDARSMAWYWKKKLKKERAKNRKTIISQLTMEELLACVNTQNFSTTAKELNISKRLVFWIEALNKPASVVHYYRDGIRIIRTIPKVNLRNKNRGKI